MPAKYVKAFLNSAPQLLVDLSFGLGVAFIWSTPKPGRALKKVTDFRRARPKRTGVI